MENNSGGLCNSCRRLRRRRESVAVPTWACDEQRRGWASVSLPKRATRPQAAANRLRERGQCRRRVGKRRGGRGRGKVAERPIAIARSTEKDLPVTKPRRRSETHDIVDVRGPSPAKKWKPRLGE